MAIERAINFPFRIRGLDEVRNAFRTVGQEGSKSFSEIEKGANGAAREVSSYTKALRNAVTSAKLDFDNNPLANKGSAEDVSKRRLAAIQTRVEAAKQLMAKGYADPYADVASGSQEAEAAAARLAGSLRLVGAAGAVAGTGLAAAATFSITSARAFADHEKILAQFDATLASTGNASEANARQIAAAAEQVQRATLQSEQSSLQGAAALARVPFITKDVLTQALDASARFADAMHQDVGQTVEQTRVIMTALAEDDMKGLVNALRETDPALANLVIGLANAGKAAQAQQAYIDWLRRAAGDGPDGLSKAVDGASKSWERFTVLLGKTSAGPVGGVLDFISTKLEQLNARIEETGGLWSALGSIFAGRPLWMGSVEKPKEGKTILQKPATLAMKLMDAAQAAAERAQFQSYQQQFNAPAGGRARGGGGGGRAGKSDAEREAEKQARDAERAREAADRLRESNDDAVESYQRRAREAQDMLGKEGDALAAVERQHAMDAAARQISTELIDKEVEARRLAAKGVFDEAAARADATRIFDAQVQSARDAAAALYDADQAQAQFTERQRLAAQIYEETRTPLERLVDEIRDAEDALAGGTISGDTFNRRMDQIAEDMATLGERGKEAWQGIGREASRTLHDIILRGGSAADILQRLIEPFSARLWEQAIDRPLGDAIDGLFGVNRDRNVAAARAQLPSGGIDYSALDGLGSSAERVTGVFEQLAPQLGDFNSGLAGALALFTSGGAVPAGGGLVGSLLNIAGNALGDGLKQTVVPTGAGGYDFSTIPGFAGGGLPPVGVPFDVGENGRERMILYPGGGGRVLDGDQTRRIYSSQQAAPMVNNQYINIPARADPRRTAAGIARATGMALGRAARKGLANGPDF
ncbi:MAG: hypothetical protein J0I80_11615 [Sphingomonas sp.]|nr:hypothetical protein [Sphingomonas sp.]